MNPLHLEPVVAAENSRRKPSTKLKEGDVAAIRSRYAAGETLVGLASSYGVSFQLISLIVRGKAWAGTGGPISTDNKCRSAAGRRVLSDSDVIEIRKLRKDAGTSLKEVAARFQISITQVYRIASGKRRGNASKGEQNGNTNDDAPESDFGTVADANEETVYF